MLPISRGALALNNMAVHMMGRGQPCEAVQVLKDSLRVSHSVGSTTNHFDNQTKTQLQNQGQSVSAEIEEAIQKAVAHCSSLSCRSNGQAPTNAESAPLPIPAIVEVHPVEFEDPSALRIAVDVCLSRPSLSPLYLRDVPADCTSQWDCHKFCGILLYNHGIACYLAFLSGAVSSESSTLDYLSEAHLSFDTARLIFTTHLPKFLSDDLFWVVSVLSLASLSMVLQSMHEGMQALRTRLTVLDLWKAMKQDNVTHALVFSIRKTSAMAA